MAARISLAGRIVVAVDDHSVDERDLPGIQARLVLALLACERHRGVTRDELADNLWLGEPPPTWQPALRGIVGRVRGYLVAAGLGDRGVVRTDAGAYHLQLPADTVVDLERAASDTYRAERALADGRADVASEAAARAVSVLTRPLLAGVEAPWLHDKRGELTGLLLRTLETLGEARLANGAHEHAVTAAEEAIALDAFRESAHRLLIRAYVDAGNTAAGLRAYERCRQLLAAELGVDPDPKTQALYAQMLQVGTSAQTAAEPVKLTTLPSPRARSPSSSVCPYRGLRTFEEDDEPWFFGRSADVSRLLDRLEGQSFLAVVGPSGSGKSSLVRAGLVPALKRGGLPGSDTWPVRVLRPGSTPATALNEIVATTSTATRMVVVVDQLEEVFTRCDDRDQRSAFLDALSAAATAPHNQVMVVVTLRADFYPRLAEHPRLADLASAQQFLVTPMDEVALAEAIKGPARVADLRLEDGLVESILADVARQPGSLPLLSHCLLELWERRTTGQAAPATGSARPDTLTLAAYHATGGVQGALTQGAEVVYRSLSATEQAIAKRTLLRLTQPGEGSQDTRRRVAFSELLGDPDEQATVESVVHRLTEARLLTTGGPPDTDRWVEVAHEALIHRWPRLRAWIEQDRAGLRVHRRLTAAAEEWQRLGRDAGALFRGAQLAEAAAWHDDHAGEANWLERTFIEASIALRDADQRRRLRRHRAVAVALAAGLVVATVLTAGALAQRERAEQQQRLAESRALAAEASSQLPLDPAFGLALAVEAVELARTREAVAALRQALVTPQPRLEVPGGRRDFTTDPEGRDVAVGSAEGVVRVWELDTGVLVHTLDGHEGLVYVTSYSPDGSLLVTTDDEAAHIWDARDGSLLHTLHHGSSVPAAAWTAHGQRLVTASGTDVVRMWDAGTGDEVMTMRTPTAVSFVELAPDGQTAVAWSAADPELFVIDAVTGRHTATLEGHEAVAVEARVAPDGRYAVSVGLDATARLWDLDTAEQIAVLDGFAESVWIGRFSGDSSLVLAGDATGTVRVAEVPSGQTRFERHAHAGAVVGAAFSPDGAVAVTVSIDGSALVWDLDAGSPRETLTLNGAATLGVEARSVLFTPDGERLLTRAATVQVWDVPPGPLSSLRGHTRAVAALGVSPDGARLATGAADGTLRLWDLVSGEALHTLDVADATVSAIAFSADGSTLVTANPAVSAAAEVTTPPTTWDVANGRPLGSLPVPSPRKAPCPQVCQTGWVTYSPDGSEVLTAGQEGVVRLWDASTGELRRSLDPTGQLLRTAVFSPDGRWVAAAGWHSVPLWDAASGALVAELAAPGLAVAFDPAGDLLAVGGDDGIATLWEPASASQVGELRHSSSVMDVAWSPDGRFLLTAAGDGARLWDVASRQQIQEFTGHGGVHAVAFTSDDTIVVGAADGTIHLHGCTVCGSVDELLEQARARGQIERAGTQTSPSTSHSAAGR